MIGRGCGPIGSAAPHPNRQAEAPAALTNSTMLRCLPALDLVVPQEPIITPSGVTTPAPIPVPDMFATVRDNPIVAGQVDYLGVVGSKYAPVQNEAACAVLDAI